MSLSRLTDHPLRFLLRQSPHEDTKFIPPMLCATGATLPEGNQWSYEIKWDGYRALAIKRSASVSLLSRNAKPLRYPQIIQAIKSLPVDSVVLDGELVALADSGRPCFQSLIKSVGHICYYAFDVLHADGRNVRNIGLELRKPLLQEILLGSSVRYSGPIDAEPAVIAEHARKFGLEGIVAKRKTSTYEPGKRSGAWTKFRLNKER